MINWLVALQNPYDEIKFKTNHDDNYLYLGYYEFFDKLSSYRINNPAKFRDNLDEIGRVVILDLDTGKWERQPIDPGVEHTMEELIKLNPQKDDKKKETNRDRFKNFITKIVRKDKNVLFGNK